MGETQEGVDFELQCLYYLDSKDRQVINKTTGKLEDLSNIRVKANSQVGGCSYFSIMETTVSNSVYNVNSNNNILTVTDGTGTYNITVAINNYILFDDLKTALQTAFGANYTVTVNATSNKYTISKNDLTNFSFKSGSITNALIQMMGFDRTLMTGANSYTSDLLSNLNYTRYIDICSQRLSQNRQPSQTSSMTRGDILLRINVSDVSYGTNVTTQNVVLPKYKLCSHGNISENIGIIDIQIYDEWGQPFNMGFDYCIKFAFFRDLFNKKIDKLIDEKFDELNKKLTHIINKK